MRLKSVFENQPIPSHITAESDGAGDLDGGVKITSHWYFKDIHSRMGTAAVQTTMLVRIEVG
jgi:hypothetical protein